MIVFICLLMYALAIMCGKKVDEDQRMVIPFLIFLILPTGILSAM